MNITQGHEGVGGFTFLGPGGGGVEPGGVKFPDK